MEEIEKFYNLYSDFKGLKKPKLKYGWFKRWRSAQNNFFIHVLEETGGIKGLKICEIGCSYGNFLELLRFKGGHTYGVEIDNNCLESLKERGFLCSKEIDLSQKYDIVCMLQLLEHIINPSQLLSKIANSICQDGRVLISVPNAGEYYKIGSSWIGFRVDLEHINYWTLHSLAELLIMHGLIIEHFWEHKQPAIQRAISVNEFPPIIRFINSAIKKFLNFDVMNIGTFVLTVLARKF